MTSDDTDNFGWELRPGAVRPFRAVPANGDDSSYAWYVCESGGVRNVMRDVKSIAIFTTREVAEILAERWNNEI